MRKGKIKWKIFIATVNYLLNNRIRVGICIANEIPFEILKISGKPFCNYIQLIDLQLKNDVGTVFDAGVPKKSDVAMSNLLENWYTRLILLWPGLLQRILENS